MADQAEVLTRALRGAAATREIILDRNGFATLRGVLARHFPHRAPVIIADSNTFEAAGRAVRDRLAEAHAIEPVVLPGAPRLKPRLQLAAELAARFDAKKHVPVAVGAGVLNDLVKHAAWLAAIPYACVPTAASMDGYAASGAALLVEGVKRTVACAPPAAIVADLDVVAAAPPPMAGWGYGDLAGKIVAGLDWVLADALGEEPINRSAFDLVQTNLQSWLAEPSRVAARERASLKRLLEGLMISGLAIQEHGNSRPASGSEHQFSHLWEMEGLEVDGAPAAHGACVGVGSVAMLALYEWLLQRDIPSAGQVPARPPDADLLRAQVDAAFAVANIREGAWIEVAAKAATPERVRARIERLQAIWPDLRAELRRRWVPPATLRQQLAAAGASSRPADLKIGMVKFAGDHQRARLIRRRYTCLDLLADLGWLDRAVGDVFACDGFWGRQESQAA